MKRLLLVLFLTVLVAGVVAYVIIDKPLPEGRNPAAADRMAMNMLEAVNDSAWQQTGAVSWTFMGGHEHLWDRERHLARVRWKSVEAFIDINTREGQVFKHGKELHGKHARRQILKAWKHWVNDSFWLNPVSKAFDPGTERSLVTLKDGREGLMVTYTSGGNTPGDSYVWLLDDQHLPYAWKMWVSVIPIGGLEVPWSEWTVTATGVKICILHDSFIDLKIGEVQTATELTELTGGADPFALLF